MNKIASDFIRSVIAMSVGAALGAVTTIELVNNYVS